MRRSWATDDWAKWEADGLSECVENRKEWESVRVGKKERVEWEGSGVTGTTGND